MVKFYSRYLSTSNNYAKLVLITYYTKNIITILSTDNEILTI